jgi:hypothetical protein
MLSKQMYAKRTKVLALERGRKEDGRYFDFEFDGHFDSLDIQDIENEEDEMIGKKRKAKGDRSKSRKKAKLTFDTTFLRQLARSTIYRGEYYGITGNALIVTRAAELVASLTEEDKVEVEELTIMAKEWQHEVRRRRDEMGVSADREELLPKGMVWVTFAGRAI